MDYLKLNDKFDAETLNKLAEVITPTATREEIVAGAAKLGVSLSEEQLSSICEFIDDSHRLSDEELAMITGGKRYVYRKNIPETASKKSDYTFEMFLQKFFAIFGVGEQK